LKKLLVVLLALALVLSMTGMAFARCPVRPEKPKCCPTQSNHACVTQRATISNYVSATTGPAVAVGNVGLTSIRNNDSTARSCSGCATNTAPISVNNIGTAFAVSGNATASNTGTNTITQTSTVTQSNTSNSTSTQCGVADNQE